MRSDKAFGLAVVALLWSAFLFGAGWLARDYSASLAPANQGMGATYSTTFPLLDEVWGHVRDTFAGTVPSDTVRNYGAVRGAVATLGDRYSVFVEPKPRALERDHLRGQFGGIGAGLDTAADGRIVLRPNRGSPAEAAGVKDGDILVAIDGVPLPDKPDANEVVARVRGDIGTIVRLSVLRGGKVIELSIKRGLVEVPSVDWRVYTGTAGLTRTVGYIGIHQFTERTASEVQRAIAELRAAGSQAYLIDLRDNGGGLFPAAIDVASLFLKDGTVVWERKRDQPDVRFPVSDKGAGASTDTATRERLAVLMNGNTASASEIVAGAIQDYARGKLIGDKSFGKGSVQAIYDLSDGSSVHITMAKWLTPNQRAIDGTGLTPDISVSRPAGEAAKGQDTQLDKALAELRAEVSSQ
jgi:carboxyl-terminal processing protease